MIKLRHAKKVDASYIAEIYNVYVKSSKATLTNKLVSSEVFAAQIENNKKHYPFYVAVEGGTKIVGFCCLRMFCIDDGFLHTARSDVYVANDKKGQGIGKLLIKKIIADAPLYGIKEVVAIITTPNIASELLVQSLSFVLRGTLPNVGKKFDDYHTIQIWQRSLL